MLEWLKDYPAYAAGAGALITFVLTILVLNVTGPEKCIKEPLRHLCKVRDPQFMREMGTLLGPPVLGGMKVEDFQNGDEIFPAMLSAIRGARRTITFETFIYWSGDVGREFRDALVERARAGVKVHIMLDWVGSQKVSDKTVDMLREAGAEVEFYHPLKWYTLSRFNSRTHRKLLVIDGRIGFTGGVGVADQWRGSAQDPAHWRDMHFRIEGPVVAHIQAAFMDNWITTSGRVLQGEEYFPAEHVAGEVSGQMFMSSPRGGGDSMQLMYLMSIAAAETSIDLAAAYFVPDSLTRQSLIEAVQRGVTVRVILPGKHIDEKTVRRASRADWGELLEAGVEIHVFEPTMFHCKMLIVDGHLVSVGSTNFDNRSFRLNDEANLNVYDEEFARRMTGVFEGDLKRCRQMSLDEWRRRPWSERLMDKAASLVSSQL
ncbi:phospholipase D-like domain-containing protein [Iodidimonas sp. SYSU 1G8]|uniref:phospholipase D-like domain-containing protein n=1 Tax=Iodidimonas sp. SYSU 1G8 TaxID=3133967 RepID=UPI0031FF155B